MDKLWEKTVEIFPILDRKLIFRECSPEDLELMVAELKKLDIAENIYETVFLEIGWQLRQKVSIKFWQNFRQSGDQDDGFCRFQKAVEELHGEYRVFLHIVERLQRLRNFCTFTKVENARDEAERFNELFRTTLLSQLPVNFNDIVVAFYNLSFRVFANNHMHEVSDPEDLPDMDDVKCSGCQYEADSCRCQELINAFNSTNRHLIEMGLLDRVAGFTLTNLIEERIESSVKEMCKGVFVSNIETLERWLTAIVINWLIRIYNSGSLKINEENSKMKATIAEFRMKLNFFMHETYANVIIEQFFDIIIDYPLLRISNCSRRFQEDVMSSSSSSEEEDVDFIEYKDSFESTEYVLQTPKCEVIYNPSGSSSPHQEENHECYEIQDSSDEITDSSNSNQDTSITRKRRSHSEAWSEDPTRKRRKEDVPYIMRNIDEVYTSRGVRPPCHDACKFECTKKFTSDQRQLIFDFYWSLRDEEKCAFYDRYVTRHPVKKHKRGPSRRNITYQYFLEAGTGIQVVCKKFFLSTLDIADAKPAIDDLKVCFEKVDLRPHLVQTLKLALETRLLHPGVDTADILTGYVSAIKAIRHLDTSGVLLETITEPVKEYLRSRNDTVRCVVTGLIEDGPTDLAEELAKSEILKDEGTTIVDDLTHWESWTPDPVDANPSKGKPNRSADIISMVVDIYGSKEVFVNEYKNLLAERLLTQLDLTSDREIRNLELLKLRFGESVLHSCGVMLKDICDSKRINSHIQSDSNYADSKDFEFSSLILSAQFWPGFKKEELELPEEIQAQFEKYRKSYEAYKGNRTLLWRPVSGKVTIDVEHMGKVREFAETKEGVFILVDDVNDSDLEEMQTEPQDICDDDEESENAVASASDQREEELQVFWSYIVGMLTNLDSLPIERIHQMLKMFASNEKGVEFSLGELKDFLQTKVRDHQLIFASGVYHLPK
ncbi:Anaphase-promoting complex subunit 2 [Sergentomyia squamirostris]